MALNNALSWYQKKVGAFDKQLWERTVENRVLRGLSNLPKKNAKLKTELIDVDLVRGSAFPKAKPEHGLLGATFKGFIRTIFLPIFYTWWIQQTNVALFLFIFILYLLQIGLITVYYLHPKEFGDIQQSEVVTPSLLMIILGILNSQIVSTHHYSKSSAKLSRVTKKKKVRRKSRPKATCPPCMEESKSSPETASEDRTTGTCWKQNCKGNVKDNCSGSELLSSTDNEEPVEQIKSDVDNSEPGTKTFTESGYSSNDKCILNIIANGQVKCSSATVGDDCLENILQKSTGKLEESDSNYKTHIKGNASRLRLRNSIDGVKFPGNVGNAQHRMNSSCESDLDNISPTIKFQSNLSDIDWASSNPDCNSDTSDSSSVITDGGSVQDQELSKLDECENPFAWDNPETPFINIMASSHTTASDKGLSKNAVSCTIWENNDYKKVDLTVLDISSSIIRKVDMTPESTDYFKAGMAFCLILCLIPCLHRLNDTTKLSQVALSFDMLSVPSTSMIISQVNDALNIALGSVIPKRLLVLCLILQRLAFSGLVFFLLAVAERTFKQRYLYAKHFSHLTSLRRARKSELPHFRLNKVRNIKTWLSVRSYLKKLGPQRSVDVIVSSSFLLTLLSASFLCVQLLKNGELFAHVLYHWELTAWTLFLGVFLLRFITLGSKINHKYRNLSVLITEQINLYLHMEQKPHKKEELMLAHSVLKLAAELLKELESPYKISGISANSYLHNFTKIVVLSAFSAVLTEMFGFRLKLSKMAMFKV